jgi:hypothetical protein
MLELFYGNHYIDRISRAFVARFLLGKTGFATVTSPELISEVSDWTKRADGYIDYLKSALDPAKQVPVSLTEAEKKQMCEEDDMFLILGSRSLNPEYEHKEYGDGCSEWVVKSTHVGPGGADTMIVQEKDCEKLTSLLTLHKVPLGPGAEQVAVVYEKGVELDKDGNAIPGTAVFDFCPGGFKVYSMCASLF